MLLKSAVIGLGRIGAEPSSRFNDKIPEGWLPISHVEAMKSTVGLDLVALCDPNEERLHKMSVHYSVEKAYTDYKMLLVEIKPDIVSIATRTDIRCEIIEHALDYGVRGFYAEKPISRSIYECRKILAAIQKKDAKIVYGANRRAMDVYKKAKQICLSGELGEIIHISAEFGKAPLLWTLPHVADMILYFAGTVQIESINGICNFSADNSIKIIDADPLVNYAFFKFGNGITASISSINGLNIRIGCTRGNLTIHGDGEFIEINSRGKMEAYLHETKILKVSPAKSGTQCLFEDLRDALKLNKPVENITPEEILAGQKLLFGIVQSALKNGSAISTAELNEDFVITGKTGQFYA